MEEVKKTLHLPKCKIAANLQIRKKKDVIKDEKNNQASKREE